MANETVRFLRFRSRSALRRHLGAHVTVILIIGLLGGLGLASLSAARRTQSAFSQYLAETRASDVVLQVYFDNGISLAPNNYNPAFAAALARLPNVASVSAAPQSLLALVGANGKPYLSPPLLNNEIVAVGTEGGEYYSIDRMIADQGRLPDPTRRDEIVATAQAAAALHWKVGQVVPVVFYSFAQAFYTTNGLPSGPPPVHLNLRLVGIVALSTSVAHDQVDAFPQYVVMTPALTSELSAAGAASFPNYFVTLRNHSAASVAAIERDFIQLLPSNTTYNFHLAGVTEGQVQRATKPEAIAIGVFGAIAIAAALLIAALVVARTLRDDARERETLRALGAGPAMLIGELMVGTLSTALVGYGLSVLVAVVLSPLAPLGEVRTVDPRPGMAADWSVIGLGAVVFVGVLSLLALGLAVVAARPRTGRPGRGQVSTVVSWASSLGLPAPALTGLRFAVISGSGPESVPVTSAFLGAVLAVGVVATTLTFGSGLHALVARPSLYGWNWDYAIENVGNGTSIPQYPQPLLNADPYVAAWSGYSFANAQIDGQTVPILLTKLKAAVAPAVLSGRDVEANDEVVLGPTSLAQLHTHIGGIVTVSYGAPKDAPVYLPPRSMRVVGTATLPSIGNPGALHTSMGTGAVIPAGIETPAFVAAVNGFTPPADQGPNVIVVRLRAGVNRAAAVRSLNQIVAKTNHFASTQPTLSSGYELLSVQQPAEIVNYRSMGVIPSVLAGWLALGATVALALVLFSSVRRRRRELALLKTLGLVRRQLAAVVSWQASADAVVGAVVGVPLGIVLGRVLWTFFAREISAVPQATVPVLQVVLVGVAALVLANLVALAPARLAARTPAGSVLVRD